ncbi:MAG: PatB family C-S lyase, partial [Bacteroidales bacterium]|nr:PatB family C-S lyase [Bacteroidales bacterium]
HQTPADTIRPDSYFSSIINWQKKRHNWDIKNEWISFSPGVVPAVNLLVLEFSEPGDKIIVQPPVYFPFFSAIKNHGRIQIDNPLLLKNGRYHFDFEDLKLKIDDQVKMIIISNPHNPGGMAWTSKELTELAEICIENDILIISDEIHSDLMLFGNKHIPMATLSERIAQNTICLMAPSKTFNIAGLSSSFLVIPNSQLHERFEDILEKIHIGSGNIFGTVAMEAAYTHGEVWLDELLNYLEENINYLDQFIKNNIPKIKVMIPESTYMVWLDFSAFGLSENELNEKIIGDANLGFNPGEMFGAGGEGYQRINVACPKSTLTQALDALKPVFENL